MPNRKRQRDPKNLVAPLGGGVWVEPTPYEVNRHELDGVVVDAVLEWNYTERTPYIVKLAVERGTGEVTPDVLRKLTVPYLAAVASTQARFWLDPAGTEPSTEERLEGETLEHWAARLFWHSMVTREQPAKVIARVQGITEGSASQRITVCRKMGLLEPDNNEKETV